MPKNDLPREEKARAVYLLILEDRGMTAAELRERTGYTQGEIISCITRLHNAGFIRPVRKVKGMKAWTVA